MPRERINAARHGSPGMYQKRGCRCDVCRAGWREYQRGREDVQRYRARNLADGLDQNGRPRAKPYSRASLELMARFGLEPDPRFVREPED
jgi:hypothetical protein